MENAMSARRLRKSVLNNIKVDNSATDILGNLGINSKTEDYKKYALNPDIDVNTIPKRKREIIKKETKINKIKLKFLLKCFFSILIVFSLLIIKLLYKDVALNNKYCLMLINEYKNDYSKQNVIDFIEKYSNTAYLGLKYILPDEVINNIKTKYTNTIKPFILNFNLKDTTKNLMNIKDSTLENSDVSKEAKNKTNSVITSSNLYKGVGGGEPLEAKLIEENLTQSQKDVNEILLKKLNIVKPVEGTFTSGYGDREQIFEGVNPYHTGVDIANLLNTQIKSATDGKVTKVMENDKYYGNFVEIELDGVTFKYADLNEIWVKEGDNIKQNDIVGLMGSTGMSTGSHLHFEIRINGRSVDPEEILDFNGN